MMKRGTVTKRENQMGWQLTQNENECAGHLGSVEIGINSDFPKIRITQLR